MRLQHIRRAHLVIVQETIGSHPRRLVRKHRGQQRARNPLPGRPHGHHPLPQTAVTQVRTSEFALAPPRVLVQFQTREHSQLPLRLLPQPLLPARIQGAQPDLLACQHNGRSRHLAACLPHAMPARRLVARPGLIRAHAGLQQHRRHPVPPLPVRWHLPRRHAQGMTRKMRHLDPIQDQEPIVAQYLLQMRLARPRTPAQHLVPRSQAHRRRHETEAAQHALVRGFQQIRQTLARRPRLAQRVTSQQHRPPQPPLRALFHQPQPHRAQLLQAARKGLGLHSPRIRPGPVVRLRQRRRQRQGQGLGQARQRRAGRGRAGDSLPVLPTVALAKLPSYRTPRQLTFLQDISQPSHRLGLEQPLANSHSP